MSRIRRLASVAALGTALCLSGCYTVPGGLASSTKPLTPGKYTKIGPASGSAWGFSIIGIPISEAGPQVALERALDDSGGDALIQATMVQRTYPILPYLTFLFLYQTQIEGTAVKEHE